MVVTGSPLVSWDALEADIRGWCSYIDECRLTGDEFVGRYTRFGSTAAKIDCVVGQLPPYSADQYRQTDQLLPEWWSVNSRIRRRITAARKSTWL